MLVTKKGPAMLYRKQGYYTKAEPPLIQALKGRRLKLGDKHPNTIESWNDLINLYEAWNKPEKADEWRSRLLQTEKAEDWHEFK